MIAAKWRGGKLSDNQWGLVIRVADDIELSDFDIVGSSEIFKDHTATRSLKLCHWHGWDHDGLIMPAQIWRTGHLDPMRGIRLKNVNISGYDKEKTWYPLCRNTRPILMDNHKYDGHYDYISSFENVNVVDSRDMVIEACHAASSYGFNDIVINDIDGSLDPAGEASNGALVSDNLFVHGVLGEGACTSIGSCMAYCPNVCLRTFSYLVEQFGTENWKLRVSSHASYHYHTLGYSSSLLILYCLLYLFLQHRLRIQIH